MVTKLNRIAVFCGASRGSRPEYAQAARQLAKALVEANITLIYGGGKVGLMGELADQVLKLGGEIIGIIPSILVEREIAHPKLTKMHIVHSMHERKQLYSKFADGFIMLPGGAGSLEEFFEVFVGGQLGFHKKPCGILNVVNYYDLVIKFLGYSVVEGFSEAVYRDMIIVEDNAQQLLQRFTEYQAPAAKWVKELKSVEIR